MCDNCDREHENLVESFGVPDIAGVSLLLINTLAQAYLEDDYCDPVLYKSLQTARQLAVRLAELAEELGQDEEIKEATRDIVEKIDLTLIQAGETINTIIEKHDLPVTKNTFQIDLTHPKMKKRLRKARRSK